MADAGDDRLPEEKDVSPRVLVIFVLAFVAFLAITLIALWLIFNTGGIWPAGGAAEFANARSPALQRTPRDDLATLRRREETALHKLGWTDRKAGFARIPIEDAMKLIAQDGLPVWRVNTAREGECAVLTRNVPRTPQAANCQETPVSDTGGGAGAR